MFVNILGTQYEIIKQKENENPKFKNCDGYCDFYTKKIYVMDCEPDVMSVGDLEAYTKKITRHEIIHAFMFESGLDVCSDFARNETLVDWLAIQIDKIHKVTSEV